MKNNLKLPSWLKKKSPTGAFFNLKNTISDLNLNTVCNEAKCPNRYFCFKKKRATFLALGKYCTRQCKFCAISFSKTPPPPDEEEPNKIAQFAAQTVVEDERIPHMTAQSVHAILGIAEKLALETDKRRNALTLRLRKLGGIIRIAGDLAVQDGSEYVLPKHVVSAESLSRGVNLNQSNLFSQNPEQISQDYGSYFF